MSHPLSDHPLPGIDPLRLEQLGNAGLDSLEDVIDAGPERLAELTGFDLKTSRALVRLASSALSHSNPDVIQLAPLRDEPGSSRFTRGLGAARVIEAALSHVRIARSWGKQSHAPEHYKRARRQLDKLLIQLELLQQLVLSDGLSQRSQEHLVAELQRFEAAVDPLLSKPPRRRVLKRLRRLAKNVRHSIEASLSTTRP